MSSVRNIIQAITLGRSDDYKALINATSKEELEQGVASQFDRTKVLDCAAKCGEADALALLFQKGLKLNTKDRDGLLPIHNVMYVQDAIKRNACLNVLIAAGVNVNETTDNVNRQTALHLIIARAQNLGYEATLFKLLQVDGIDVNVGDSRGQTPLDYAYEISRATVREALLQLQAKRSSQQKLHLPMHDRTVRDTRQHIFLRDAVAPELGSHLTPLCMADRDELLTELGIPFEDPSTISAEESITTASRVEAAPQRFAAPQPIPAAAGLTESEVHVYDIANPETGESHFHIAVKFDDKEAITRYCESTPVPLMRDAKQNTIYHVAAMYGRLHALESLHSYQAGKKYDFYPFVFERKNSEEDTALHLAVIGEHAETVAFILDKDCRFDIPNKNGRTAFELLKARPQLLEKLSLLKFSPAIKHALGIEDLYKEKQTNKRNRHDNTFFKKVEPKDLPAKLKKLEPITNAVLKSGKITPNMLMMLNQQALDVLQAYSTTLNDYDAVSKEKLKPLLDELAKRLEETPVSQKTMQLN